MEVQEWGNLLLRGTDTADRAVYMRSFHQRAGEVRSHLATVRQLIADKIRDSVAAGGRNAAQVDRLVRDQDRARTELLGRLLGRLDSLATARMDAVDRQTTDAVAVGAGAAVITFLALTAILVLLVTWLLRSLGGLRNAAQRIAAGDLTQTVTYEAGDEIGALADAFRHMPSRSRHRRRRRRTV
jgi:methyl-accepting chemotaxis protein